MSDTMAGKHLGSPGDDVSAAGTGDGAREAVGASDAADSTVSIPQVSAGSGFGDLSPVHGPGGHTPGGLTPDGGAPGGGAPGGAPAGGSQQMVTCPECGTTAPVTLNRRDSHDFCGRCDYPLFWTPSTIEIVKSLGPEDASLRRLPGTAGRQTIASQQCPHCAEANTLRAVICVRCGQSMLPEPVVVPVAAPAPLPPAPVPVERTPWWWWALGGVTLLLFVALLVFLLST